VGKTKKTRYPGLLRRVMERNRSPGRQRATSLTEKFPRRQASDGTIYEARPDGWRRVGFKA